MRTLEKGPEYRRRRGAGNSETAVAMQYRPLWRDIDVLHVFTITFVVNALTFGLVYAWFMGRTLWVARTAPCEPGRVASVVVFGKRLVGGRPDTAFRWRLRHALRLLRANGELIAVLSGGRSGGPDDPSEAQVASDWLSRRSLDGGHRLRIEGRSLHTIDNLREARRLLPPGPVALVSNRYHLPRCLALARSLGIDARACAAEPALRRDCRTLRRLALEAGYLMVFTIGRRWARLIGNRRMLSRIG